MGRLLKKNVLSIILLTHWLDPYYRFFSNLVDKMPDYKRLISCDINMLWLSQYLMYIDITRTPRLRRCMSDELKSMAHSLRTAGPGNALIGFES